MKIDSHQHFWTLGRFHYPWMSPDLGILYRNYEPNDLIPLLQRAEVKRTILVQASPSLEETDWLLELADRHPFIAGVVGWLDLESPDFPGQLDRYRKYPKWVGVRPAVEFIEDDRWLLRPRVLDGLKRIAEANVPLDLILWPRHLSVVVEMLEQTHGLRCVVDHLANPPVAENQMEPWRSEIARIANHPTVFCKISGFLTPGEPQRNGFWKIQPYVDHVMACFGEERVMWGSDWPVCLRAGDYETNLRAATETATKGRPPAFEEAFLGGNAARFYKLEDQ